MRRRRVLVGVGILLAVGVALWLTSERTSPCDDPPVGFDLERIRDQSTLHLEILATDRVVFGDERVLLRRIAFDSFEWKACGDRPSKVEAYLAQPASSEGTRSRRLGGVVRMHGVVADDVRTEVIALAAESQMAVIGYVLDDGDTAELFDTVLYTHAVATMRSATVLGSLPEVDPHRLAMAGASAAGLVVSGADDRFKATVVRLATLPSSNGVRRWFDPQKFARAGRADVLLIAAAHDEDFSIPSVARTFEEIKGGGGVHRLYVEADAVPKSSLMTAWWLRQRLFQPERPIPKIPAIVSATVAGSQISVAVVAAGAERVRLHMWGMKEPRIRTAELVREGPRFVGTTDAPDVEPVDYFVDADYPVDGQTVRLTAVAPP